MYWEQLLILFGHCVLFDKNFSLEEKYTVLKHVYGALIVIMEETDVQSFVFLQTELYMW